MDKYVVKRYILALALQAQIEGMKAYNLSYPENIGYGQNEFENLAKQLDSLANKPDNEL